MAKRRKYIYANRRANRSRSIARGTAAAILVAAVVYFAVAGGLGGWIAENFVVPFMNGENPRSAENPVESTQSQTPNPTTNAAIATETPSPTVTQELTLPSLPFYSIQLGAFVNRENAESEAESIRERGAAGYIYQDEDRLRVLASAYLLKADAEKVKAQLLSQQGLESYVLALYETGGAVTLRVTATSERVAGMEEAVAAWRASLDEIEEIARRLDLSESGPDWAKSECRAVAENLIEKREALIGGAALDGNGAPIEDFGTLMDAEAASLLNISDQPGIEAMEISAQIKYTYIEALDRYGKLLRDIART